MYIVKTGPHGISREAVCAWNMCTSYFILPVQEQPGELMFADIVLFPRYLMGGSLYLEYVYILLHPSCSSIAVEELQDGCFLCSPAVGPKPEVAAQVQVELVMYELGIHLGRGISPLTSSCPLY